MNGPGTKGTQMGVTMAAAVVLLAGTAGAQGAKPLTRCAPDAVVSGTVCMDKYEASVWRVPNATTTNRGLVLKIQQGKATAALLAAGGATQLGSVTDDYTSCADSGQNCADDIYAVSLPGVRPSGDITWFQAQAACKNARKRLPSNAEWQAAVAGTPDPGIADNGTTDCNTNSVHAKIATGSRSGCVSADGAFDMVGNEWEWTADWVPRATTCGAWSVDVSPTGDRQCVAGAATAGEPGVLLRGGYFESTSAGPLAVDALAGPSFSSFPVGFRCAR